MTPSFEKELQLLIEKHGLQEESGTPSHVLTYYIMMALKAFDYTTIMRDNSKVGKF